MNNQIIDHCMVQSLAGKMSFPEVVKNIAEAGAERYIVDLISFNKITYGLSNEYHDSKFKLADGPEVPEAFDAEQVRTAIHNIQLQKIDYQTFLARIMKAGCCHYEVYIRGRKAIYFGRDGNFHIENFPSK